MTIKQQISLSVVAVIIFSINLCCSTQDVINRNDFIKDHTIDIANIIHGFNNIIFPQPILPPANIDFSPPASAAVAPPASPPFEPRVVCIVSKDELTAIWNEIERDESAEVGRPMNFTYSENCNKLEKIKTGMLKLKHDFKALLKQNISSVRYEELKASYENEIRLLSKRLEDEKATAKGEQMTIVGELQDQIQKLQDQVNETLKKLEEEHKALNEAYVGACVANIDRNEIDKAVAVFKNISDYREIKRIASSTYSTKPESYDRIILFVRNVADPEVVIIGYTCLFDELTKLNELRDMRILILANELRTKTDVIFKELKGRVMGITEKLIQKNDVQGFIDYANTKGASRDIDFVKQVMPMIVEMVYNKPTDILFGDDPRNVEFLMNLLPKFSNLHHRLYIINDLITVMKEVGHTTKKSIFSIIHKAIEVRTASEKIDDQYVKNLISEEENNLPEGVRVFMSSNACIKNLQSGQFMFMASVFNMFAIQMDFVSTATSTNANNHDLFSHIFDFTENGNVVQIRNVKSSEFMSFVDIPTGIPFLPSAKKDKDFILDIVSEGKFTIKSKTHGYLFPTQEAAVVGTIVTPGVSDVHLISARNEESTKDDAIWLIKQCE